MSRILIFVNGHLPDLKAARELVKPDDLLIAADGGLYHILDLGLRPHSIVGDLDSISLDLEPLTKKGVQVIRFPGDKDETDLELTLTHALTLNPDQIVIVAGLGGRLDQTLGNIGLLDDARLASLDARIDDGLEEVFFCRDRIQVHGRSGDTVSLIPWQGEVHGVLTNRLRWPLQKETLYPHKTRGISNEMLGNEASVEVSSGLLLVIHRRQPQTV
jgi:thiamine pyrophosphokinase